MRYSFICVLSLLLMGAAPSCVSNRVKPDTSELSAIEANDFTVFIEGCKSPVETGFNFCRVSEGGVTAEQKIAFIVPPAKCKSDKECVYLKIIFPTDRPPLSFAVPKNQTRLEITWDKILDRATFEKNDRGFWGVEQSWKWIDLDGNERESLSQGFIYLRVVAKNYTSLVNAEADPNFAWQWVENKNNFNLTTQGRASVWKSGQ